MGTRRGESTCRTGAFANLGGGVGTFRRPVSASSRPYRDVHVVAVVGVVGPAILHRAPSLGGAGDTPDVLVEDDVLHAQGAGVVADPVGDGPPQLVAGGAGVVAEHDVQRPAGGMVGQAVRADPVVPGDLRVAVVHLHQQRLGARGQPRQAVAGDPGDVGAGGRLGLAEVVRVHPTDCALVDDLGDTVAGDAGDRQLGADRDVPEA